MADGRRRRRLLHSYEISNLTYGHFGAPVYNKDLAKWHFQRYSQAKDNNDAYPNNEPDTIPLQLVQPWIDISNGSYDRDQDLPTGEGRCTSKAILKCLPQLTANLSLIKDATTEVDSTFQYQHHLSHQIILTRALDARSQLRNRLDEAKLPLIVSVNEATSMRLTLLQVQEDTMIDDSGLEVQEQLLSLSESTVWSPPLKEPLLQLCCSSTKRWIALRQNSGITVCIPDSEGILKLRPILRLPISRTGGHPHADVSIKDWAGANLGVIDVRGNWSTWQILKKEPLSGRLLHQAKLMASGKLWTWTEARQPPRHTDSFFDGWHKICFFKREDNAVAILVVNRQSGILYDADGVKLQNVDLRSASTSEWALDVWVNADASTCLILTSSRVLLLRMKHSHIGGQTLRSMCSPSHFLGGALTLKMSLLELPGVIHVFLYSARSSQLTLVNLHCSEDLGEWSFQDPIPFHLGSETRVEPASVTDILFLPFVAPSGLPNAVESRLSIKVIGRTRDGHLSEALYLYIHPSYGIEPRTVTVNPWPTSPQKRFLSTQVIDEEDDDDVDEFVVQDGCQGTGIVFDLLDKQAVRQISSKRNYSWIFMGIDGWSTNFGIHKVLAQAATSIYDENGGSATATLLRELVANFWVEDVEEAHDILSTWIDQIMKTTSSTLGIALAPSSKRLSLGFSDLQSELTSEFMEALSDEVDLRVRISTERLARQVAMDVILSSFTIFPVIEQPTHDLAQGSNNRPQVPELSTVMTTLGKYTSITKPPTTRLSATAVSDLIAHLPDSIDADPEAYSHGDVELSLARKKFEGQELDLRARRRAKKVEAVRRKRIEKSKASMKTAHSQETPPAIVSSSQDFEQRGMTQPERGDFGTRPVKASSMGKKKQKLEGFG